MSKEWSTFIFKE